MLSRLLIGGTLCFRYYMCCNIYHVQYIIGIMILWGSSVLVAMSHMSLFFLYTNHITTYNNKYTQYTVN